MFNMICVLWARFKRSLHLLYEFRPYYGEVWHRYPHQAVDFYTDKGLFPRIRNFFRPDVLACNCGCSFYPTQGRLSRVDCQCPVCSFMEAMYLPTPRVGFYVAFCRSCRKPFPLLVRESDLARITQPQTCSHTNKVCRRPGEREDNHKSGLCQVGADSERDGGS